jgi:hypothetical protein
MKIKFLFASLILVMVAMAGCGPAVDTDESPNTVPESEGALEPVTQPAPEPTETEGLLATSEPALQLDEPDAYPAKPTAVPPTEGEGYPAPEVPAAITPGYPEAVDGFVWMLLPTGVQCEEESNFYSDLQDAVAGLTAVDVQTGQSEVTELAVCSACGCPASTHYRVQVSVEDVSAAQTLGWTREP